MKLKKSQKKRLISIIAGTVLFAAGLTFKLLGFEAVSAILFVLGGAAAGYTCVIKAFKGVTGGNFFDENTLMTIAALGAVIIGEYAECCAVLVLYQVGEFFSSVAVGRSRAAIKELSELCPDIAHKVGAGDVSPDELLVGDVVEIRPGERIPADCIVLTGDVSVDTSSVTGESVPREATVGDTVYSGCICTDAVVTARVIKIAEESAAGRIMRLCEEASDRKTVAESFITRFAKVYTPAVTGLAVLVAGLAPLICMLINGTDYIDEFLLWSRRALSILVISCPCALVISVPLGYFCALGNASKSAIMIKGSVFLDTLAKIDVAAFDKTGTLTEGRLDVSEVKLLDGGIDEKELLSIAEAAERHSSHPIAKAIISAAKKKYEVEKAGEEAGHGVFAEIAGLGKAEVVRPEGQHDATAVDVKLNGKTVGHICFSDRIKESSAPAFAKLKELGIKKTVILSGDNKAAADVVGDALKADEVRSELLPEEKFDHIEELCRSGKVMYVGDGINDSPSLARSDAGVAMGVLGTNAATDAADVVLMSGDLSLLAYAVKLAKKTSATVRTNIIFSLAVKFLVLLAVIIFGLGMWPAVLADVGVMILCVANSMRLLKKIKKI